MLDRVGARLVAACASFVSACHSAPTIAFADFAQKQLDARCTRLVRCGAFESASACGAYFHLYPDQSLAAAVAGGEIRYDGVAAAECVSALAAVTCDDTARAARVPPSACDQALVGEVKVGDACAFDLECASGRCTHPSPCDPAACCAGSCTTVVPVAIGAACNVDGDCVGGAYCGTDLACHALGRTGDSCLGDTQCDYGFGCVTPTFPGTCQVLGAPSGPCPGNRCADAGTVCVSGSCIAAAFAGAACPTGTECSPFEPCNTTSGQCASLPDINMQCTGRCEGDAWCDTTLAQCEPLLANGAACDTDHDCASGFCQMMVTFDQCEDRPACK
jgi:hypothetical protein